MERVRSLNLIMTGMENFWDKSPVFFDRGRCLTEYILPDLKEKYVNLSEEAITDLKELPCVFAYEKFIKQDAKIGYIKGIEVRQTNVRIDFELSGDRIAYNDFFQLAELLDMGSWECNRTHWTVKKTSLEDIKPYFVSTHKKRPTVFVSYSWTPPSNQQDVFTLIGKLEKDGIGVIYDKKALHPGQDMNYFMENALLSKEFDCVIIVCNSDYAQKANSRKGGVGYESELILTEIRNDPLQTKYIPVIVERDINGEMPLPSFLKSRLCIDLTQETGYEDLLEAIHIQYSNQDGKY